MDEQIKYPKYLSTFDNEGNRTATYLCNNEEEVNARLHEGCIEISEEDWNTYIGNKGDGIRYVRGENGLPTPYITSVDEVRPSKLNEVSAWTEQLITSGFTSSCSGESVHYDSDVDTQITMQGIALNASGIATLYPSGIPVRGYVGDSTEKTIQYLNAEQLLKWCADLSIHIGSCKQQGWTKQAEVNACTTVEELNAITL